MTDNDLCYISAVEAITAFKSKKLSPVELMQAVIARAEAVNPPSMRLPTGRSTGP